MKYLRQRYVVLIILVPIFTLLSVILTLFFSDKIILAFQLHWLILLSVIILCITPFGSLRFDPPDPTQKPLSLLSPLKRIVFLQICFIAVFLGITITCAPFLQPNLFINTLSFLTLKTGLFPWALVAIFSCAFALIAYRENKDAYISTLTIPLIGKWHNRTLGNIFDYDARLALGCTFATTIAFLILITAHFISLLSSPISMGFQWGSLTAVMIVIIFVFTKPFHIILKFLFSRKYLFAISLLITILLLAGIIVLLNNLFSSLNRPTTINSRLIQFLNSRNWHELWLVFSLSWWVAWTPLAGAYVAQTTRGMNIRQIIFTVLLFPLLLGCGLAIAQHFHWTMKNPHPYLGSLIALLGFLGLSILFTEKKMMLPALVLSYLPKSTNTKSRGHHRFFRKIFMIAMFVLYFFMAFNIPGVTLFIFFATYSFAFISLLVCTAFIKKLINLTRSN